MNSLSLSLNICQAANGGILVNIPPLLTQTFVLAAGVLGGSYAYSQDTEKNVIPLVKDVAIAGITQPSQVLTVTFNFVNDTQFALTSYTCKIYGSIDRIGGGLTLITTLTGTSPTFNYTLQGTDIGYGITAEITATIAGGATPVSDTAYAPYTAIVLLPPSALDAFGQVRLQNAGIPSDWNTNAAAKWADYSGTGNYAYQDNVAVPQLTAGILRFVGTSVHRFKVKRSVTLNSTTGCEVWIKVKMNSTVNSQALFSISNTHLLRVNSGVYELSGVATPVFPVLTTVLIRVRWFNAATEIQINNGTVNTITTAAFAISVSDAFLGVSYSLGQAASMDLYDFFISTRNLTSGEQAAIWSYFGY